MAEARIAVAEPLVSTVEEITSPQTWKDVFFSFRSAVAKRYYKARNLIYNGVWPASLSNVRLTVGICLALMLIEPGITSPANAFLWRMTHILFLKGLPRTLQASIVSCFVGIGSFFILMIVRQGLLRLLLTYRGWMAELKPSSVTKVWGGVVRLISGYKPSLYSCQRSLPRLPVPNVHDTLERLYASLKPLCTEEELKQIMQEGKEFENTLAHKLQKVLVLKSWFCQNYVSDWWEKYAYLRSRTPLPNNSNYYCCDECYWVPTNKPISRTAYLIYNILMFKRLIDREELEPLLLKGTVPVCMAQYERVFGTARIPGEQDDRISHCEDSKHIIIAVNGIYYKLDVCDSKNQLLVPTTLEKQLTWIVEDAKNQIDSYSEAEKSIAALTALNRPDWADIRKKHLSTGANREARRLVEKAIFCVTLTDYIPPNLTEKGKYLLHGDGKSIWFDKSLSLIVFGNAAAGFNCEHTVADAPAMAHMWEYAMSKEVLEKLFDEEGNCMPFNRYFKQGKIKQPQRIIWEITPELETCINRAVEFSTQNNNDIDLEILDHNAWGKGIIKKCKVSPDAFVQLALQLAYYKDAKKFVQTYEASMTRLYLGGRTETVRSCTVESKEFVLCMMKNDIDNSTKKKLLIKAAKRHQQLYREAMNGKGIDRHLFALYIVSKGYNYECEFLRKIITRPWIISTSQTPHSQLRTLPDANLHIFKDKVGAGGGFGPVSDEGYGVSYLYPSDDRIFFHVSSKHSCPATSSKRFLNLLVESMEEMVKVFDVEIESNNST